MRRREKLTKQWANIRAWDIVGLLGNARRILVNALEPLAARVASQTEAMATDAEVAGEVEQIINMVVLPVTLERFFLFSLLACVDCFIYYFTIVPLRLAGGLVRRDTGAKATRDLLMLSMIVVASAILLRVDTSRVYHRIKGQSAVKLYMMFQVLDMCDKMLASLGQNLLSTITVSRSWRARDSALVIAATGYLVAHAFVLIYQTIALNVAVNSYSNSLLTLLLSMQFAELKASVFKRMDKEGVFQLAIADIVERFQLLTFLTSIAFRNVVATGHSISQVLPNSWQLASTSSVLLGVLYGPMVTVIGSELLVDWVKHGYVTKFNRMRPHLYDRFLHILCHDHQTNLHKFQTRIGLPVPALVVLFIVLVGPTVLQMLDPTNTSRLNILTVLMLVFICMVLAKFILQALLMKWAKVLQQQHAPTPQGIYVPGALSPGLGKVDDQMRATIHSKPLTSPSDSNDDTWKGIPPSLNELRNKKDAKHTHSLETVERFKMVSKRIW
ncbi:AaceriAFR176Wp [[Ashbya] aceris (nom. inval.)]|nr:AaceriAFR176Wp [[Ashbya] aceris (nom. inval.)]